MKKLIIIFLLTTSCASVPQERLAPDTLFEVVNIKDNNPKRKKWVWKNISFKNYFIFTF